MEDVNILLGDGCFSRSSGGRRSPRQGRRPVPAYARQMSAHSQAGGEEPLQGQGGGQEGEGCQVGGVLRYRGLKGEG